MATKSHSGPEETETWLTLTDAADYVGVVANTIRNWRDGGFLHPKKELRVLSNGARRVVEVYDPDELRRRRPRRDNAEVPETEGAIAARAFALFGQGVPLMDVVIQLEATPQLVDELHDHWQRMSEPKLIITPAAKVGFERIIGPFDGVAGLVDRLEFLVNLTAASK